MGDRGQVKINGVYLYTHWGATSLVKDVQTALKRRWRWDDHEYLARIILDVMVGKSHGTERGYGIGTEKHGDIWRLVEITNNNEVIVTDCNNVVFKGSFEEFIEWETDKI